MNHQQIREELSKAEQTQKAASESIARLTKLLNEPEGCWKPSEGDLGWGAYADGEPCQPVDLMQAMDAYAMGSLFKTKKEAVLEQRKSKVIQKLRELAGGFKPDWKEARQSKWCIYRNYRLTRWETFSYSDTQGEFSLPYFETKEAAQAAITTLGDELNVLLGDA